MTTAGRLAALLLVWVAAVAGCRGDAGAGDSAAAAEPRAEYEAVARQFGEHVLNGDWAAAYAMTTAQFHGVKSEARLRAEYDNLLRHGEDDPGFRPNRVERASACCRRTRRRRSKPTTSRWFRREPRGKRG